MTKNTFTGFFSYQVGSDLKRVLFELLMEISGCYSNNMYTALTRH